jgi:hypothetical protein
VEHGDRGLAPCHAALPPEMLFCRRTPRRQGLNAVGHDDRDVARRHLPLCRMAADVYSRNFWFVHLFFENQRKNIKKFDLHKKQIKISKKPKQTSSSANQNYKILRFANSNNVFFRWI